MRLVAMGACDAIDRNRDRFERARAVGAVDEGRGFRAKVACGGAVIGHVRRGCGAVEPGDWGQFGTTDEIVHQGIGGIGGRGAVQNEAVYRGGWGGVHGEGEDVRRAGDRDDAIEGAEVGGECAIVECRSEDELGEPLGCMRRGVGEGGSEGGLDGGQLGKQLWGKGSGGTGHARVRGWAERE